MFAPINCFFTVFLYQTAFRFQGMPLFFNREKHGQQEKAAFGMLML